MKTSKFVIEASEAESMAKSLNLQSLRDLLPHLVPSAQSLARAPISKFNVGAVGLGSDGRIYLGVNVEFPFVPLHHSIHAEQFLLTNLSVNRCTRLLAFAVSAAPCGHCRQFLQELRYSSDLHILITQALIDGDLGLNLNFNFNPLLKLLPHPFGPHDLLDQEHPLLLEQHDNQLELIGDDEKLRRSELKLIGNDEKLGKTAAENGLEFDRFDRCEIGNEERLGKLKKLALEAANNAHAPYSGCAAGVALMDSEGKVYRGSYAESAAYNPSLGPVQAALVAYIAGGGGGYEKIVAGVLVEKEGAIVKQEDTARMLLKAVSPKCELTVILCRSVEDNNGYIEAMTKLGFLFYMQVVI